jgi:hypothetical protein
MKKSIIGLAAVLTISGCATAPDKIATTYVSPLQYQNYDCGQIAGELERVTRHAGELNADLAKKASNDTTKTTVGVILFFPVLFFLDGNSPQAAEYAQLKGERDALEKVAIEKKCMLPPLPPITTVKKDDVKSTTNLSENPLATTPAKPPENPSVSSEVAPNK